MKPTLLKSYCRPCVTLLIALTFPPIAFAQRDLKNIPPTDPELERRELQVADGFDIQLYAADPLLAKPIQMNFDARGRLWIAASEVYPQIRPGQAATDKILVLDDTDGDGRADSTTVFADGLLIPTGVLPGDGGCYVANSTELLHLADTDGDGRADQERVMLSGFGTEDTHHILHTLRWGPDSSLYMNQSIYIHSHLETPTGVKRMNGAGVWRFRPAQMDLQILTLGLVNPWGTAWDKYGATFETDGAGGEGINYVFPGFVGITSPGAARVVNGLNPGKPKLCGLEIVGGSHLPDEWQGNLITNDFRAHRVCRYVVTPSESGFQSTELDELVKSTHVAFRPIDVKLGPDGAIYIADWYNPIIQHGEVDFRDPRRDHVHGRIWRITAKNRPLVPRIDLTQQDTATLVSLLASPEPWQQQHARQVLKERGAEEVVPALDNWVQGLTADQQDLARLNALWMYQALDRCPSDLLESLLSAGDGQVRAGATRVLGQCLSLVEDPLAQLTPLATDEHPRVRLEAVRALSGVQVPQACVVAMRAVNLPRDRFLDFCLWQTARDLQSVWLPAFEQGKLEFDPTGLVFALQAV
ncbi:MAG: HEAT repeat domain-containing protein, partial [Planctomycetales bacterium]|nr:HEAT repeat domain-containing protein [Planctomycetales bacterium]